MKKTVRLLTITALCFLLGLGAANASIIASVDFDGRTISGNTASNLNWNPYGIQDPGDLSADFPLFTTTDAQDKFAVQRNLHDYGPWLAAIDLTVLSENHIDLGFITLDAYIFNFAGDFQNVGRDLDLNMTLYDSTLFSLESIDIDNIFTDDEGTINQSSGGRNVSFDFTGYTLTAGDSYLLRLTASNDGGKGNNAGFDNLVIKGDLRPIPEPAAMLLFGFGLLGIAGVSRRRKA